MHTAANCPLRSMAWITTDQENNVVDSTSEMMHLLGSNPVDQPLDSLWTYHPPFSLNIPYTTVTTQLNTRVLSLCFHPQTKGQIIVCSDMTDLQLMHHQHQDVSILRLSTYGTIEAVYPHQDFPLCTSWVGQPVMRYMHSDDVKMFCAGISKATRLSSLVQLDVRLEEGEQFEWSLTSIENGKQLLCFVRPNRMHTSSNRAVHQIVTEVQQKFWKLLENGFTWVAHHLAYSILVLVEILWGIPYKNDLAFFLKKRPEIDSACHWISYIGIPQQTSRAWFDHFLDQTFDWFAQNHHDLIV